MKHSAQALSLVYGTEVFLVLKDIWGLALPEVTEVARWTAQAIIRQALADAAVRAVHRVVDTVLTAG